MIFMPLQFSREGLITLYLVSMNFDTGSINSCDDCFFTVSLLLMLVILWHGRWLRMHEHTSSRFAN